ncbi:MAG TPA: MerR family transcriptional regulator [Drouetiella sp.]
MSRTPKVEGTKIAQAAKDLNVTSVTIRRYLTEFNIETTSDENGIKVLPDQAMEELKEIRRLKEEGLTNPKVLEILEESRSKPKEKTESKGRGKAAKKAEPVEATKEKKSKARVVEEDDEEEEEEAPKARKTARRVSPKVEVEAEPVVAEQPSDEAAGDGEGGDGGEGADGETGDGRSKHSLTCQTCGKVFEHMNPRLRDCLDCYRAKRKERRRGGADRHKNVIQHPLAQQAASTSAQMNGGAMLDAEPVPQIREERGGRNEHSRGERLERGDRMQREPRGERGERGERDPRGERGEREPRGERGERGQRESREREFAPQPQQNGGHHRIAAPQVAPAVVQRTAVRNYRKAIEETRTITGSLKRRLERPDLPEGERRWLEQIYAYQLILHQGWRHLSDYKSATQQQGLGKSPAPAATSNED